MIYNGSEIICTSNGTGQAILNFFGSQIKGFQSSAPNVVKYMSIFTYFNNILFDPYMVRYSITCPKNKPVKYQTNQIASRYATGQYYANYIWTPITYPGQYTIVWEITDTQFGQTISKANTFSVYRTRSENCIGSDIASTGGSNTVDGAAKQSGACNTLYYGVGQISTGINFQVLSGCGCA